MNIHALTVSVNYSDYLALGIERWASGLASWTIVTDPTDEQTRALALRHGCNVVTTNLFYERGAAFNKGAAMEFAQQTMPWRDWIVFLDADVVPEPDWRRVIECDAPQPGNLYG